MNLTCIKTASQLRLGFGVLALLIVLIGGGSFVGVADVGKNFKDVMDDRYPIVNMLQGIEADFNANGVSQRDMILMTDADDIKKEMGVLKSRNAISADLEQ